ncbi:hypothetical protein AB0J83_17550 [Actinoplanes sp. NPDC049596]|uniref:hypothetical protein n=1 Tax=unclassified Actinoplanes TaxID=2626549 RepID=UPI0034251BFF
MPIGGDAAYVLLDTARLDASGRFSARRLLRSLGWPPGHRVDAVVVGDAVVFAGSPTGQQAVGSRGELAVPAATRALAGIDNDGHVVLAAVLDHDVLLVHAGAMVLLVHARAMVTQLLPEHYADLADEREP